jgi:hypothetical protein
MINYADPCPCRYCVAPKRHPGCHDTCTKEYIPWRARLDARKAEFAVRAQSYAYIADANNRKQVKIAKYKQSRRTYFRGVK